MKIRRTSAALAVLAATALVTSACTNAPSESTGDGTTNGAAGGGTITVAETNTFFSFNPNTSNGNTDINSKIIVTATRANFYYVNDKMEVVPDTSFGTYEIINEDPFTVTYTVNEGVTWSDGEPIDADDLVLAWAIESGHYNGGTADAPVTYFDYAGATDTIGLTDFPEIGADGRSITLTYSEPAADWEIAFLVDAPAHVVAKNGGLADGQALIDLLKGLPAGDESLTEPDPQLQAVVDFWNTGYDYTTLPDDPELYLASGPFIVSGVVEDQTVTLVRNDKYTGDLKPQVDEIVMRSIPDATAAVQALQNGEVDVIAPQSSADTLQALQALDGITVHTGDQLAYDHLDLVFNNGGPFDPATYGGDAATAQLVREAFLAAVPRQAILEAIVTPQSPDANVLNSNVFVASQAAYADTVTMNGSDAFPADGDVEHAKELLAEAGVTSPTVRILYNIDNPNRVNAYTLIAAAATEAGFVIDDQGDADWGARLGDGSYDATVFGWISPGVGVASVPQIFMTAGGGNYNGYSNADVDALATELNVTLDEDAQIDLQRQVDAYTFADAYGLPLFQSPGLDAVSDRVGGIDTYMANQTGVWWNVWEWTVND